MSAAVLGSAATGITIPHSDVDIFLVRDHNSSGTLWSDHVGELVTAVTGWTGNDARVVEYPIDEPRAASAEPMGRYVVDHGLTVAGSRAWLIRQLRPIPNEARVR